MVDTHKAILALYPNVVTVDDTEGAMDKNGNKVTINEAQDVLFQRALESGADTTAIVAEKQRLRDITNQVDSMTTVDELKGVSI